MSDTVLIALLFEVGGRRYAVDSVAIREVVRSMASTLLPDAPPFVEGVVDVRGLVVPVIDLRSRLLGRPLLPTHTDHLIVVDTSRGAVALRVDQALELMRVDTRSLHRIDGAARGSLAPLALRSADGLVLIPDLDRFLSEADASALQLALERASSIAAGRSEGA